MIESRPVYVYIAGLYLSNKNSLRIGDNVGHGVVAALLCIKKGHIVMCPETTHESLESEFAFPVFSRAANSLAWLLHCDAVLLAGDYHLTSLQTQAELREASKHGLPVFETVQTLFKWFSEQGDTCE